MDKLYRKNFSLSFILGDLLDNVLFLTVRFRKRKAILYNTFVNIKKCFLQLKVIFIQRTV